MGRLKRASSPVSRQTTSSGGHSGTGEPGLNEGIATEGPGTHPGHARSGLRIGLVLLSAAGILIALEAALQIRSHLLSGRSVFNYFTHETRYVEDARTGLKLLRPNAVLADRAVEIRTNSLGLRSPEILPVRTAGSFRIAVIGASAVMGPVAATNDDTFSALLATKLRAAFPERVIEVINAGIAGYTLKEERLMLERIVLPLRPDLVIIYPGVNDFRQYCEGIVAPVRSVTAVRRQGLPVLSMPDWTAVVRATSRGAEYLHLRPMPPGGMRDPYALDRAPYRSDLEALARTVLDAGTPLLLLTVAKAYRDDQSREEQERLAAAERAHTHVPCFDLAGLHAFYDLHNAEIRATGGRLGIPVLPLDQRIPGGARYFADAFYFSRNGEQLVADEIFGYLVANQLIPF